MIEKNCMTRFLRHVVHGALDGMKEFLNFICVSCHGLEYVTSDLQERAELGLFGFVNSYILVLDST